MQTAARLQERVSGRAALTVILLGAFLLSLLAVDTTDGLLHTGGLNALAEFWAAILRPDLSPDFLKLVAIASFRTLAYAVAGMSVALVIGIAGGVIASGVLSNRRAFATASRIGGRGVLAFLRSIHELIWALLFVAAIGLSPLAGVLAIGIPYGGILGRILATQLQDVPEGPLNALRTAGASEWAVLIYGRLPMALPDMISYSFYRLECAVRAAAVLSFIGLGGIGFRITVSLADLRFDQVWTLILALIALVVAIDAWSVAVRRRLLN